MQRGFMLFYCIFRFLAIFSISSLDNSPSTVKTFVSVDQMTPAHPPFVRSSPLSSPMNTGYTTAPSELS